MVAVAVRRLRFRSAHLPDAWLAVGAEPEVPQVVVVAVDLVLEMEMEMVLEMGHCSRYATALRPHDAAPNE